MPIYEYQCQNCGHHLERIQRLSDLPLSECEECGGELKKLISAPAFQFKGTGWYVTDYAKKGSEGGKKEGSSGEASSGKDSADSAKSSDSSGSKSSASETKSKAAD